MDKEKVNSGPFEPSEELKAIFAILEKTKAERLEVLLKLAEELKGFSDRVAEIKITQTPLAEGIPIPALAHPTEDVGFDLRTAIDFSVQPGEMVRVPTGLIFNLPTHDGLIRIGLVIEQRTGNGSKGLFPAATIVDPGYRPDAEDENGLTLSLRNVGNDVLEFKRGDAVMQGLFVPFFAPTLRKVEKDEIDWDTKRGEKRFGATGN